MVTLWKSKFDLSKMTEDEPTDADLRLVARHGSGPFERALALVRFARRHDRVEELREIVNEKEEVST